MLNEIITTNYLDKKTTVSHVEPGIYQALLAIVTEPSSDSEWKLLDMVFKPVTMEEAHEATHKVPPLAVIVVFDQHYHQTSALQQLKAHVDKVSIPLLFYSGTFNPEAREMARKFGFDDYYFGPFSESLRKKFYIINQTKIHRNQLMVTERSSNQKTTKTDSFLLRRILDVSVSILILMMLSPLLLIIALIIKLESKGPVFYISKRAGNNYQIFDFYKFRSMNDGADAELETLIGENQYITGGFVKIKSDPRVTPFGKFLRKTSLDEIPQLINVIKGDMCLVGNRPLPLYEAIELTIDQYAQRFLAPAGITGLWQITKRGKEEMSAEERIHLDIVYAQKTSFLYDMKLLINTIPAMWQKETV